jgi:hypothetical protein
MGLVIFTYNEASSSSIVGLRDYILCESGGQSDCVLDLGINADINTAISTITYIMISLPPVLAILFSFNPKAYTGKRRQARSARSTMISKMSMKSS